MENEQIVIAFVVVVIGYSSQYWYAKRLESKKHKQNLRTNVYLDLIGGIVGKAITQKNKSNKEEEFDFILTGARARLLIYGSKEVIESFAKFWRNGGSLNTLEERSLLISTWQTMRKEISSKDETISNKDVSQLLFDIDS